MILPFRNVSGDRSLDYLGQTIAEQLRTQIGQSRALRAVSSAQIGQILSDLRFTQDTTLDHQRTLQIATLTSSDIVISGQFGTFGSKIQITANLQDLPNDRHDIGSRDRGEPDGAAGHHRAAGSGAPREAGARAGRFEGGDRVVVQSVIEVTGRAAEVRRGAGPGSRGEAARRREGVPGVDRGGQTVRTGVCPAGADLCRAGICA